MTIPLIFWLVLSTGNATYGQSITLMPTPFGSQMDCDIAGAEFIAEQPAMRYRCLQQRLSDFEIQRNDNGSYGWRKYPQASP